MTRYTLFSEYGDRDIWGENLADAIMRNSGHIYPQMRIDTDRGTKFVPNLDHPLIIDKIEGMRDTSHSRRGNWEYESCLVRLAPDLPHAMGRIIAIDARVMEHLPAPTV